MNTNIKDLSLINKCRRSNERLTEQLAESTSESSFLFWKKKKRRRRISTDEKMKTPFSTLFHAVLRARSSFRLCFPVAGVVFIVCFAWESSAVQKVFHVVNSLRVFFVIYFYSTTDDLII